VAIVTSASGSGGTTVGRELAERLEVPFHELDALFWRPSWTEPDPDDFRTRVADVVATDAWVIDGSYQSWLGQSVLERAEVVVWLDLPVRTWFPRLIARTFRRVVTRESLWGTNRETIRGALFSRDSLLVFTARHYRGRRRVYPERFATYDVVRLRSQDEVDSFLRGVARET
jgi:adenylate kinase family enzyme